MFLLREDEDIAAGIHSLLGSTHGVLKAVIDEDSGKIFGIMLLCGASYEMVNVVKLAIALGADYRVLRDQIFTHPAMTARRSTISSPCNGPR